MIASYLASNDQALEDYCCRKCESAPYDMIQTLEWDFTPPETNSSQKDLKKWHAKSRKVISLPTTVLQVPTISFKEGIPTVSFRFQLLVIYHFSKYNSTSAGIRPMMFPSTHSRFEANPTPWTGQCHAMKATQNASNEAVPSRSIKVNNIVYTYTT